MYGGGGSLEVEIWESTVTGSEGNDMGTKINILVIVAKANFYIRDTNLI